MKSVALEMLRQAKEGLGKGIEPVVSQKLVYEGLRQILLDDYRDGGKLVMDGEDPVITGRRETSESAGRLFCRGAGQNRAKDSWSVRTSSAFDLQCRNTFTRA